MATWVKSSELKAESAEACLRKDMSGRAEAMPESRRVKFVVSTSDVDRDNDVVKQDGWQLGNYMANPVVLWAHSHSELPIGKCVSMAVENGNLTAICEFADHEFADKVFRLVKGGFLNATSVGFRAVKWRSNEERGGTDFVQQELLEFSVVPVPANQHALVAASAMGEDVEQVRQWAKSVLSTLPSEPGGSVTKGAPAQVFAVQIDATQATERLKAFEAQVDRVRTKLATMASDEDEAPLLAGESRLWNKSLGEDFDVAAQQFAARSQEQALAAKYFGCAIKSLYQNSEPVYSTDMGSVLYAMGEVLAKAQVDDLRNINSDGEEAPPLYKTIRLNSKRSDEFVVDGMRFLRYGGAKAAVRVQPRWYGMELTCYAPAENKEAGRAFVAEVRQLASETNFLKGEAFSLSGEFLERGGESQSDLFLTEKNAAAVQRTVTLLNEQGKGMDSRGLLVVGPPGTGKTLSGRILMNEAKSTFIWCSARDFWYGGGFSGMARAFEIARKCAPATVFIEDVDNWLDGYTVDLMKTEMDGIAQHKGVVTVLTTNYPELLPKALIDRPGRFHDVLRFDLPDDTQRDKMIGAWMPDLSEADRGRAVQATAGYSGAHLRELARFAGIIATQDKLAGGLALDKALEKLAEQRDLISSVQATGSRYRAPSHVGAKALKPGVRSRERAMAADSVEKLKMAHDCAATCMAHVKAVLDTVEQGDDTDSGADADLPQKASGGLTLEIDEAVVAEADLGDCVLDIEEPADDDVLAAFTEDELRMVMRGVVAESIGDVLRSAAERAVNQARGRVD